MNLNDGLIAAWVPVLGNTGKVLLDRSASRAHCDTGTMTWTSQGSYAHVLQGTGSHTIATVTTTGSLKRKYPFAFSSWFRITGLGANRTLFNTCRRPGNYAGFGAAVNTGGALVLGYGDNGGTSTSGNQRLFTSPTGVVTTNQWYHLAGVFYDHLVADAWVNGVIQTTTISGTGNAVVQNSNEVTIAGGTAVGAASLLGQFAELRLWNRILLGSEVSELYFGGAGYGLIEPERRIWKIAFAPTTGTTGTGASMLGAATSTASGTQTFAGTAAPTLAAATSTASGTQTFSGTGASTLGAATSTAAGTQTFAGTATPTLSAATSAASGTQTISGSGSSTLGDATGSASGTQGTGTVGTAAVTLSAATASASGGQTFSGTGSPSCGAATSTAVGTLTFSGPGSATLGAATGSAAGTQTYAGTAAVTLGTAYATASGSVGSGPISGTVAVTLGLATATASGTILAPMQPIFAVTVEGWTLKLDADAETLQVDADAQTLRVTGG